MGPELLALLAPFAKWGALVGGGLLLVLGGLWGVRRRAAKRAVAEDDLEEIAEAEKEEQDARQAIRRRTRRLWDLFRR